MCANTFIHFKPHQEYDKILGPETDVYFNYKTKSQYVANSLQLLDKAILYIGLLAYILEIQVDNRAILLLLFTGSFALSLPLLYMPFVRYCNDYTAYIT